MVSTSLYKLQKSGSLYFNYKNTFSVVLLAICDAHYRSNTIRRQLLLAICFILSNLILILMSLYLLKIYYDWRGAEKNKVTEASFKVPPLDSIWKIGTLNLPKPTAPPNSNEAAPYALVAGEAFPLRANIMRPIQDKIFLVK